MEVEGELPFWKLEKQTAEEDKMKMNATKHTRTEPFHF